MRSPNRCLLRRSEEKRQVYEGRILGSGDRLQVLSRPLQQGIRCVDCAVDFHSFGSLNKLNARGTTLIGSEGKKNRQKLHLVPADGSGM